MKYAIEESRTLCEFLEIIVKYLICTTREFQNIL
jgi:hypothetical protein